MGFIVVILYLAIIVAAIIGEWKMYEKAGKPGWAVLVPIYNYIVLLEIVGLPWWWILLIFAVVIPVVGWIVAIAAALYVTYLLGKSFGKETGYIIGMILLPIIFIPLLGYSDSAVYQGPYVKDPSKPLEPLSSNKTQSTTTETTAEEQPNADQETNE